ncbi:MAG: penicillin-binding protein 2, partial [Hyphomicrobiaceae bacterium]
ITLDWETLARINVRAPQLPGIQTGIRRHRVYAGGKDLGHLLGYVGRVSKHRIGDDPALRLPAMKVGRSGVEGGLDERLRGTGGSVKHEINARGQIVRKLDHIPAVGGEDVTLSIDSALQARTMKHVAGYGQASAVALDVRTGEILAMASAPSYDPSWIVGGITQADWNALENEPDKPLTNRAIRGQYPPGSTFKMVTALAALDAGVITPDEKLRCRGSYEFSGHRFGCWKRSGHGRMTLHKAIRESCDVYFYQLAERVGIEKLARTARKLGFGETFGTGLAGEKEGIVPDPAWKLFTFEKPWLGGETLLAGIGQGYVLATPLQLAVMTARLATGRKIDPTIEKVTRRGVAPEVSTLGFEQAWLRDIRKAMTAVVNQGGGTGSTARINWSGIQLAGKTGTSQVSRASRTRRNRDLAFRLRDHSLFVAFAPVDKPRYAVATVVEHGGGGSEAAAPLARKIMMDLLKRGEGDTVVAANEGTETIDGARAKKRNSRRKNRRARRRRKPPITRLFTSQ